MIVGEPIVVESLEVRLVNADRLTLKGSISTPTALAELKRLFGLTHELAVRSRVERFTVDVRDLGFVNSSSIRAFVDWISRASHAGYKLAFTTNAAVTWHRLSFSVLKTLAPESVEIMEERPGGTPS